MARTLRAVLLGGHTVPPGPCPGQGDGCAAFTPANMCRSSWIRTSGFSDPNRAPFLTGLYSDGMTPRGSTILISIATSPRGWCSPSRLISVHWILHGSQGVQSGPHLEEPHQHLGLVIIVVVKVPGRRSSVPGWFTGSFGLVRPTNHYYAHFESGVKQLLNG